VLTGQGRLSKKGQIVATLDANGLCGSARLKSPRSANRNSLPRSVSRSNTTISSPPKRAALSTVLTSAWTSDPLLGPCRDPLRDRLGGLDVQEVTDAGDDLQRVRGGEPMPVVDLRGEDAAVVGTVELK